MASAKKTANPKPTKAAKKPAKPSPKKSAKGITLVETKAAKAKAPAKRKSA